MLLELPGLCGSSPLRPAWLAEVLTSLLQPALSTAAGKDRGASACASSALDALASMEGSAPGALRMALSEVSLGMACPCCEGLYGAARESCGLWCSGSVAAAVRCAWGERGCCRNGGCFAASCLGSLCAAMQVELLGLPGGLSQLQLR